MAYKPPSTIYLIVSHVHNVCVYTIPISTYILPKKVGPTTADPSAGPLLAADYLNMYSRSCCLNFEKSRREKKMNVKKKISKW